MRKTIWDKRIPTLLGLLLITIAVGVTSFLVRQQTFFVGKASPSSNPQNVRITNITDSSFTVSYITDAQVAGSINFGKDTNLGQIALDDRDKKSFSSSYNIHSITAKNLTAQTRYFFSITSGQESFLNNGVPYQVETSAKDVKGKPSKGFVVGRVIREDSSIPKEAIVYIEAQGSQPLSNLVNADGTFSLSLEGIKTQTLKNYFEFSPNTAINMLALGDSKTSNVSFSYKEVISLPTVVLSKDYNFSQAQLTSPSPSPSEKLPSFPKAKIAKNPQITSPSNNQNLTDARPVFRGTGVSNDTIRIIIQSEKIEAQITADKNGNWTYKPTVDLTSGTHTVSIIARDSFGILRTITQTFTISPQVAQAATSSPTPTPTPTPISSAIPTTPSPSPVLIPSPTPVVIPTPTPTSEIPQVGNSSVSIGVLGIIAAVIGGIIFLLSRGTISL